MGESSAGASGSPSGGSAGLRGREHRQRTWDRRLQFGYGRAPCRGSRGSPLRSRGSDAQRHRGMIHPERSAAWLFLPEKEDQRCTVRKLRSPGETRSVLLLCFGGPRLENERVGPGHDVDRSGLEPDHSGRAGRYGLALAADRHERPAQPMRRNVHHLIVCRVTGEAVAAAGAVRNSTSRARIGLRMSVACPRRKGGPSTSQEAGKDGGRVRSRSVTGRRSTGRWKSCCSPSRARRRWRGGNEIPTGIPADGPFHDVEA